MPDRTRTIIFATIIVLLFATPALANASSAGMALAIHLAIGNLLIGLLEGGILKAFGARWRVLVLALLANYASAFVGVTLVGFAYALAMDALPGDFLEVVVPAHWLVFAGFTLLSFAIELPLVWLAFSKPRRPKRIMLAVAVANTVTAACLAAWYVNASQASLAQDFDFVDEPAAIGLEAALDAGGALPWVYYVAGDGQTVRRVRLDGSQDQQATTLPGPAERAWLTGGLRHDGGVDLLATTRNGSFIVDVHAQREDWSQNAYPIDPGGSTLIVEREVGAAASVFVEGVTAAELDGSRPADDILYTYLRRGMRTANQPEGHHYAVYLPLTELLVPAHASRLRGEIVVFELRDFGSQSHGIYVASLDIMRIARLVEDGMGPCVVYDNPPPGWDAQVLLERLTPTRGSAGTGPP